MSRLERAAAGAGIQLLLFLLAAAAVFYAAVWPYLWGKKLAGPALGVVFEILYAAAIAAVLVMAERRWRRERHQAALAREIRQAEIGRLVQSGRPFFDGAAGHFRHGTCTIKHRSAGAAGRCSSTI